MGYKPEDGGTLILGITAELLFDELSRSTVIPLRNESRVWLLRLGILFCLRHFI